MQLSEAAGAAAHLWWAKMRNLGAASAPLAASDVAFLSAPRACLHAGPNLSLDLGIPSRLIRMLNQAHQLCLATGVMTSQQLITGQPGNPGLWLYKSLPESSILPESLCSKTGQVWLFLFALGGMKGMSKDCARTSYMAQHLSHSRALGSLASAVARPRLMALPSPPCSLQSLSESSWSSSACVSS